MEERYWKQFENSGRIEDYLSFVSSARQEGKDRAGQEGKDRAGQVRADGYAGIHYSDRNYTEADLCGGIRQTYQPFDQGKG